MNFVHVFGTLKQGRHGHFLAGKAATSWRAAAVAFYSAKSRQGLGFLGLVSHGEPDKEISS